MVRNLEQMTHFLQGVKAGRERGNQIGLVNGRLDAANLIADVLVLTNGQGAEDKLQAVVAALQTIVDTADDEAIPPIYRKWQEKTNDA